MYVQLHILAYTLLSHCCLVLLGLGGMWRQLHDSADVWWLAAQATSIIVWVQREGVQSYVISNFKLTAHTRISFL